MSNYVVDASIVIQRLIAQPHTPNVQALFRTVMPTQLLIVPDFCLLECTNVIWKQVRFFNMPLSQAEQLVKDLRGLPLKRTPIKNVLDDALRLGIKHQLAVYDSVYIILAKNLGYPLITVDSPQAKAATAEGISLKPITDFK